ncbi:C69 family dipeptidase [Secundilactobacillus silagei]|uniref:Dipeptidase n=1 Tax=Secundilactobacillus silagei JCM 19001 TaxID=1302250 RepID=A0A1Z5IKQ2_9LACO|nr:C69 family dipeptidase [Secundilactobacillus silagei]TDG69007.1 hypothetical protein C5L25_000361 [Secundilactobacillus silagei JCM 19001]GAX02162.1 dipeptidase [Secundilactobacillus silagei JCM 19001]
MTHLSACTSVLVGKNASIDGSVMIARNDDTFSPLTPQRFYMHQPEQEGKILQSTQNGFQAPLPKNAVCYQATPNVEVNKVGLYEESGINAHNVAMSATESVYGNPAALAFDPLVADGMAEDTMQTMVLPVITSARNGVQVLGDLIKKYGSPEGNGVLFADKDEAWYMEIVTGHHWVAQRVPDDAFVITANQVAIQSVVFDDPDNFMFSAGIQDFVAEHHLNPDQTGWNFRHIFGTSTEKDRHYNTPRVWYGQRFLMPDVEQSPTSAELPFICHANRKISVADISFILGSHYNETDYDPLGNGPAELKTKFRPIAMNRTQNSHVLQLRNNVPEAQSAITWLSLGVPAFSPYVPFFANANDTDPSYANTPVHADQESAYWMYRKLSVLVESHYAEFVQDDRDYLTASLELFAKHVAKTDQVASKLTGEELTTYLTQQNYLIVSEMKARTTKLMNDLFEHGLELSKLTFNMDVNL